MRLRMWRWPFDRLAMACRLAGNPSLALILIEDPARWSAIQEDLRPYAGLVTAAPTISLGGAATCGTPPQISLVVGPAFGTYLP